MRIQTPIQRARAVQTTIHAVRATACLALWLGAQIALAVEPSFDELQRKLDAAKARDAASAVSARRPAVPGVRHAPNATLVVQTDAPCALSLDGKELGPMREAETRQLSVPAGPARLECRSDIEPAARYVLDDRFEGGTRNIVKMALAGSIEAERMRRTARVAPAAATPSADALRPRAPPASAPAQPPPTALGASAPPASRRLGDDWLAARARLAEQPDDVSLAGALRALLLVEQSDDLRTLEQFEASVARLRWKSALAFGQRNGYLYFGTSASQATPAWAAEAAINSCERYADHPCRVVFTNGRLVRDSLTEVAARLGSKPLATVRGPLLKGLKTYVQLAP